VSIPGKLAEYMHREYRSSEERQKEERNRWWPELTGWTENKTIELDFFSFQDNVQFVNEVQNYMKEPKNTILSENENQHPINSYWSSAMFFWVNRLSYMSCLWILMNSIICKKRSSHILLVVNYFYNFSWSTISIDTSQM